MLKSTPLEPLLAALAERARALGLTDTAWAARAGVRKETLSRLRARSTCDLATLGSLAQAVGCRLAISDVAKQSPASPSPTHFPETVDRDYEDRLAALCASRSLEAAYWSSFGPPFFMGGLAVMLASAQGFDRRGLIELAERLHPGVSEPAVFARWLAVSPLRPSRFLPLVEMQVSHAA